MLHVNSVLLQEVEMILFLILVLATPTRGLDPYKVTPLPGNPGVYFEAHGEARLIRSYWNIITTLDCRSLSQPMEWKETQIYSAWRSCLESVGHECHNVIPLESLRKQLKSLQSLQEDLLQYFTPPSMAGRSSQPLPHSITKRGAPFEFIGWTSKKLFGTMDAGDRDNLMGEIEHLYETQRNISLLAEKQTHIVRSNLDAVRQQMAKEEGRMQTYHHELLHVLEKTQNFITNENHSRIVENFAEWSRQFGESLDLSISSYKVLIDAIEFTARGNLHPLLFSHEQVQEILSNIKQLKSQHLLPWETSEVTPERLFMLSKTSVSVQGGHLLVKLKFPLNSLENFLIYKMHSLPVSRELHAGASGYMGIKPKGVYIFVTSNPPGYFLTDEAYLQRCQTHEAIHLCRPEYPIMEEGDKLHCEYSLLTNPTKSAIQTCNIALHDDTTTHWKRLETTGEWLYSMAGQLSINIICDGVRQAKIQLNGTGILSLKGECVAQTSDITLFGTSMTEVSETFIYSFNYPLNFSLFLQKNNFSINEQGLAILDEQSAEQVQTWAATNDVLSLEDIERQFHQLASRSRTEDTTKIYIATGCIGNIVIIIILYALAQWYFYKTKNRIIIPLYKKPRSKDFHLERRNPLSRSHRVRSLSTEDVTA